MTQSKDMMFPETDAKALVTDDLADSLTSAGSAAQGTNVSFLKFTKSGIWEFGSDSNEVGSDEIFAVNPASFTIGWQGWNDGVPVDGPIVPITQRNTLPAEADLDPIPVGDMNGWNKMLGVSLQSMDDGAALQYNATSYGGKKVLTKLMQEVGLGLKAHPEAPVALISLAGDKYKHKTYGWINTPVINIVGWADANGNEVKKLAPAA